MIETALVVSRWLQFAAAAILCGVPAFYLYGIAPSADDAGWAKKLMLRATIVGVLAAVFMLPAQAAEMDGDIASAFKPDIVWAVLSDTYFGAVWIVRLTLLLAMGTLLVALPMRRIAWAVVGTSIAASLAWMGHGREGEGWLGVTHLTADVLHLLAASIWIGALVVLLHLVRRADSGASEEVTLAARALSQFSGMGSLVVATLIVSGLVNAWALIAPRSIPDALTTDYAHLLLIKIGLFVVMLALAALNRFSLSPRLQQAAGDAQAAKAIIVDFRRSIIVETGLAMLVLLIVGALGMMEPPTSV